ncbi:MAG: WbqC family protein [Pirellulales bacterium]
MTTVIVTIHQPSYLPWAPFLEKGLRSDVYVLLDDVQFEKNSEQNRNRIKTAQGETWLTVPVALAGHTLIPEVNIAAGQATWARKHRRAIEDNYRKAPHFEAVAPPLFELLERDWQRLFDLNLAIDELFFGWAGMQGRVVGSSELAVEGSNWQRILNLCTKLGATTYLSGAAGFDYLDLAAFRQAGVEVQFQQYRHDEYPQLFPKAGFVPRLSALDLFMNVGTGEPARQAMVDRGGWLTADQLSAQRATEE